MRERRGKNWTRVSASAETGSAETRKQALFFGVLLAEPLYLGVNGGDAVLQHSKLAQIREKLHGMIVLRWPTSGDEIFHLAPCRRFSLRQVSQIAFSRQGREPLSRCVF